MINNCKNCGLPIFHGASGYVGAQCKCGLSAKPNYNNNALADLLKERDTLRKQLDEIRAEAELFFEWPGDDRSTVTLTSCILFADHIASPATKAVVMPSMDRCYEIATNTFGENMPQELAMKIALVIGVLMNEIESLNEGQKDEH